MAGVVISKYEGFIGVHVLVHISQTIYTVFYINEFAHVQSRAINEVKLASKIAFMLSALVERNV